MSDSSLDKARHNERGDAADKLSDVNPYVFKMNINEVILIQIIEKYVEN